MIKDDKNSFFSDQSNNSKETKVYKNGYKELKVCQEKKINLKASIQLRISGNEQVIIDRLQKLLGRVKDRRVKLINKKKENRERIKNLKKN